MMDRRTSIKGLLVLFIAFLGSWFIWKWLTINSKPDIRYLHHQRALIDELTECIIPRTATPGAKDANVADFVIGMIEHCTDLKTQNNFINGLLDLEHRCNQHFGSSFTACNGEEKMEILTYYEHRWVQGYRIINWIDIKIFGHAFIVKLKELTVQGYCTSQLGATQGLSFDKVPGTYVACTKSLANQKAWATK